jgi:CTP synthase
MVGKYTDFADSYKSVAEALMHAGIKTKTHIHIRYIDAETLIPSDSPTQDTIDQVLKGVHAILVPGGFGTRGIEGKIEAAKYAREHKIPYLGICLGMQTAVIEFARHQAGLTHAHSTECNPNTTEPVIALVTEWQDARGQLEKRTATSEIGGTMRLGSQTCHLIKDAQITQLYGTQEIAERHRHRYEVNAKFVELLAQAGLKITGRSIDGLVETIEIADHPWFIGCQFHPEFTSNPRDGHPLFIGFVQAAQRFKSKNITV